MNQVGRRRLFDFVKQVVVRIRRRIERGGFKPVGKFHIYGGAREHFERFVPIHVQVGVQKHAHDFYMSVTKATVGEQQSNGVLVRVSLG